MYSVRRVIQPHWENWVKYDPGIDSCVLPILAYESLPKLRDDNEWTLAPNEGRVYVQFSMYVPQSFIDLD